MTMSNNDKTKLNEIKRQLCRNELESAIHKAREYLSLEEIQDEVNYDLRMMSEDN